jgi:predicted PurR-regulated permease PerM
MTSILAEACVHQCVPMTDPAWQARGMAIDGTDSDGVENTAAAPSAPPGGPVILGRRRSVVATALSFALGAGLAYGLLKAIERLQGVLIMLALALLIALTLDPLVTVLQRRGIPRWAAALLAWLLAVAVLMAPIVLAVDAASQQLPNLIKSVPNLISQAENNLGGVGKRLRTLTASNSSSSASVSPDKILTYLFEGGQALFKAAESIVIVGALSLFLVMTMPRLIRGGLALVPRSRRARVELVTNDLLTQVSRFMLANVLTSVLAGVATWAWAFGWGVPYPILLGALVAVLDLIPTVGSTVGGVVVSLVALTVGLPTAIATAVFYVAFRLAEDYIIQPRAMRYSVELPGVITVPAVLAGGAVLGIPGALFAVPIALIIRVLIREVAMPALDER